MLYVMAMLLSFLNSTKSYYERRKCGYINFYLMKFPLFMLKVLMLHLFCLPMLNALCSNDLFSYKMPMHRKLVRLKRFLYLLIDALFCVPILILMRA